MTRLGRSFGFLLSSTALSNLADGVLKVGAPLMAVSFTRSPALVALAGGRRRRCRGCCSRCPRARSPTGWTAGGSWWRRTPPAPRCWPWRRRWPRSG
ncbi:hypothetical protein ACFSTC_34285 [Nonomuraea ferruginea]